MNPRILVAFAAGAMAASGIVFIGMRPGSHSAAATVTPAIRRAATAAPLAQPPPPPPAAEVRTASDIVQVQGHSAPAPRRAEKPSPMPVLVKKWPADKPEPVIVAQNRPPAPPADAGPESPSAPEPKVSTEPQGSMPVKESVVPPAPDEAAAPAREPHTVALRPGTLISVRMGQALSTNRNQPGDSFFANLDQPLVIDGWVIAARGSRAEGRVIDSGPGGRMGGGSELGVQLTAISTTDGQHIGISTSTFLKRGPSWNGGDAAKIGGAAAIGAAIGGMAGGGKGAGIGAIVGGAAGAGGVFYSRRSGADIPVETRISFRIDQPVSITEKLD